jgi:UDP-glucose 4-epimerase
MSMKTLVTGGAGFVGSHLVDALLERGDDVFVLDDLSTGRGSNLFDAVTAGAIAIPADVTDPGAVSRVLAADPPRVVFHLAGQTDREVARSDPGLGARIDVEGTVNVLEAARRAGVRRLVLASSFEVYGDRVPAREDDEAWPGCPAGLAKLAAERYAGLYAERYGLATVSVRLASVYGPRQVPLGGGGVVAAFALALTRGGSPVLFGDGLQTRDFLYVDDAVGLLLAAADSDLAGAVNAGTGRGTPIGDLLRRMAKIAGEGDPDPVPEPEREGEARHVALSFLHAAEALGWEPTTDLESGLERTLSALVDARRGEPRGRATEPVMDLLPEPAEGLTEAESWPEAEPWPEAETGPEQDSERDQMPEPEPEPEPILEPQGVAERTPARERDLGDIRVGSPAREPGSHGWQVGQHTSRRLDI